MPSGWQADHAEYVYRQDAVGGGGADRPHCAHEQLGLVVPSWQTTLPLNPQMLEMPPCDEQQPLHEKSRTSGITRPSDSASASAELAAQPAISMAIHTCASTRLIRLHHVVVPSIELPPSEARRLPEAPPSFKLQLAHNSLDAMGFRFQKRVKLLPGIALNFSKSGVSTSIGPRGAKVTIGHGKVRQTLGIPGTGISYTETTSTGSKSGHGAQQEYANVEAPPESGWVVAGRLLWKVIYGVTIGLFAITVGVLLGFLVLAFGGGKSRRRR